VVSALIAWILIGVAVIVVVIVGGAIISELKGKDIRGKRGTPYP